MKDKILQINKLSFEYPSYSEFAAPKIIKDLSANIYPESINIVFGRPESGKSTLALILSGLVPAHTGGEISGSVIYGDINILESKASEIINKCGIVFQDPEKQTVTTNCFTEAAFALESLGVNPEKIKSIIKKSFSQLEIEYLVNKPTSEISGGEKKKVALAGLLSVNPEVWLLDELMEELDNPSKINIFKYIKKSRKTVIFFTSKYHDVFEQADNFYLLKEGQLSSVEKYPFRSLFKKELMKEGVIPDKRIYLKNKTNQKKEKEQEIISVKNLKYSYEGGDFKLNIDEFCLKEGEVVSIVGLNGCGKSTFCRILCGLIKPDQGKIFTKGIEADTMELNTFCAYMFQNPDYQIFLPTVFDELAWGMKAEGCSPSVIKAAVKKTIEEFSLPEPQCPPSMMSYSARKRLQAGIYSLLKRPVFILDEADVSLSYHDFIDLIERLKTVSKSLIIITHNLWLASVVSSRVIGMKNGCLYEDVNLIKDEGLYKWLSETEDDS